MFRQLYDSIRRTILAGQLGAGVRLPATRMLASELDVSRNTIVNAFDQLLAEVDRAPHPRSARLRLGDSTIVTPTTAKSVSRVMTTSRMTPARR